MGQREFEYRNTVNLIALALLIFSGAFLLLSIAVAALPLGIKPLSPFWQELVFQAVYGLLYAATFLLPVLFFYCVRRRACIPREPYLKLEMSSDTFLYLFAGLAVINAAAMLNADIMELFGLGSSQSDLIGEVAGTNYELVLQFIVLVVIPSFVEELLFRGVILTNLLPFGQKSAVLVSALLFGLMHQNFSQLLYATVAGAVLGYIYVQTRSIWPCVTLHFANNALSVILTALFERLPVATATTAYHATQLILYGVGLVCAVVLILRHKNRFAFQPPMIWRPTETVDPLSGAVRVRAFFTPAMIAFFVFALTQAVLVLVLNVLL